MEAETVNGMLLKCCVTSTETVGLLGTGREPRTPTSTFTQLLNYVSGMRATDAL